MCVYYVFTWATFFVAAKFANIKTQLAREDTCFGGDIWWAKTSLRQHPESSEASSSCIALGLVWHVRESFLADFVVVVAYLSQSSSCSNDMTLLSSFSSENPHLKRHGFNRIQKQFQGHTSTNYHNPSMPKLWPVHRGAAHFSIWVVWIPYSCFYV